ncbi:hypothetical protein PybrP1_005353 [[Pythium] brassicae (nom. inval.)]|nr:hypothetical protein PybrP1_005353 [[Pythium] brassicae (nom. inval.)]
MAKWLFTPSTGSSNINRSNMPPAPPTLASLAGRPLLLRRGRSGSLNALDKPPPQTLGASEADGAINEHSHDEQQHQQQVEENELVASKNNEAGDLCAMASAAMAIPQFRRGNQDAPALGAAGGGGGDSGGAWLIRRRGRSVSDNSSASTSSMSSSASAGRFSLRQLSADVSAFRSESMDSNDSMDGGFGLAGSAVVAPALPRPPYPVDPYHFYCLPHLSAGAVLSDLATLLNDCDVEHSLHALKCKFKCVKYVHYSQVEFIVRVYAHQSALLVECQRRSGSLLLWDGLYNIVYHQLADIIDPSAPACSQSGGQKRVGAMRRDSLSVQIWRTISVQTPSSGVEAMKIMLTSKYTDAQREGCAGLAVLTEDALSAYLVAKHDLVGALVAAADADDFDMARCAVGALANIAKALRSFPSPEVAERTRAHVTRAATTVVELLAKTNDTSFSLELLRECARALCAFSGVCPQHIVACEGNAQLARHASHRDAQLAGHCRAALQLLQQHSV